MSVAIQSLPSSSRDAAALAARLGVPFHEIAVHAFPDGERRVTVGPASDTTIIYASLDRPNDKLVALMFAADALRGGIWCNPLRMLCFQVDQLLEQRIIFRIGNFRLGLLIVQLVVIADFFAQFFQIGGGDFAHSSFSLCILCFQKS